MRLYPKVIPTIAREVVQALMQDGDVEVETMRIADAEMDMASVMKEYLAAEERVNGATREALERLWRRDAALPLAVVVLLVLTRVKRRR